MNHMTAEGPKNESAGRIKKDQADRENDKLKKIEGREEEKLGQLQKEFGASEEQIVNTIEKES